MAKLKATEDGFNRLVAIISAVPFASPGRTLTEIMIAVPVAYSVETMAGILSTQVSRGWLRTERTRSGTRYTRVIRDVHDTLSELIEIV